MIEQVFREERGRLLAALVHRYGDLDLAEEVCSEAVEAALRTWPRDGVPAKPGAWLLTTARRKALDRLRRDKAYAQRLALIAAEGERHEPAPELADGLPDERLRLFFTCAHPALAPEDRTALTLRCLAGMETPEVARAFLVPTATMAQRIVRAKKRIREARIPFRVPGPDELPARLPGVLQVLYLVFTTGYADDRVDLAQEAVRLGRILYRLLPAREVAGLLGLMLLTRARNGTVPLEEQDRTRWDASAIAEGTTLAETSLTGGPPGPYGVQAAIAALHAEAPSVAETDWAQIVALYDVLYRLSPGPVVALNRAAALALRDGPEAGLAALPADAELRTYPLLPATRADLLERLGRTAEAIASYEEALRLAGSDAERDRLRNRLDRIGQNTKLGE